MKIRTFLFGLLTMLPATAMAQYDLNAAAAEHAQEVTESIEKMNAPGKQNDGPEAFKVFIEKFSTDPEFMNSRIDLPENVKASNADLLVPENFQAKMPEIRDNEGMEDVYYQVWDEMQFHTVHLSCCWDGIIERDYVFMRKNGKWYLSQINS